MKNKSQLPKGTPRSAKNNSRPEIRDDIDSRSGEEQEHKGDDVTNNAKEHKNKKQVKR